MTAEEKQYLKKLGANIKKIRLKKGLKQTDLAYTCDFDRQNMYHIETGKHNLTVLNLRKLAKGLEVGIGDLTDL